MHEATYDLEIPWNGVLTRTFVFSEDDDTPVNLTGYDAEMQGRETYGGPLIFDYGDYLTIDALTGTVVLAVPTSETRLFTVWRGVSDLRLIPPSGDDDAYFLINLPWKVNRKATREDAS